MSKIVDQFGKPFTTSIVDEMMGLALSRLKDTLHAASKPSALAEHLKIMELRRSCGVDQSQETIKFRRFLPYKID
jgi:hypothetical protein